MISLETKADVTPSLPLSLSTPDEESTLSFSELLRGAGKKDDKVIQNGILVLSLGVDEKDIQTTLKSNKKQDTLLSLLKNDEAVNAETKETLELNPKLMQNLSSKELKILVADAKQYLKSKIMNSDGYKKLDLERFPKTLKGLASLAKKVGIDISKISIQEVRETNLKTNEIKVKNTDAKELKTTETKEQHLVNNKSTKVQKTQIIQSPTTQENTHKTTKTVKEVGTLKTHEDSTQEDKKTVVSKNIAEVKPTLLFKAQNIKEYTTEQIVQAKQFKIEVKTPKEKADDTLKLLLRGEKVTHSSLTADFSVATAKVIAPKITSDISKSLEVLLHGEKNESSQTNVKTDSISTHKTDSFEVKLNEAKQMIKYISQDVKTALQEYKSPFTRIKVQLNPQKLGEVDLTIVQRGKNLHVNISSNNTAINTLAMNASELKTQLSNSGINNATLNFNNSSQNSEQQSSQQQNRQNERKAEEEYAIHGQFDKEETNEEILSSLEIVVPNYA
ncbi:flagellar hook-length control protein FliK [Sulfurimonas sp.]|uniref:flagellar hook-length control protein FliK n=1 Tax=Sulfurimonas sp. TaxID=2022749 RepID=UPI002B4A5D08|nr:flagellar hook-length control protein FliK [Sulfurimonas sp.]